MAFFFRHFSLFLVFLVFFPHHRRADAFFPLPFNRKLASVLGSLGYQQMASASLSLPNSSAWFVPATIFAPTDNNSIDASFHLNDHIVPGLFTLNQLCDLKPGTLIPTLSLGGCLSFTAASGASALVNSVPIVEPDMYNNGPIIIHGIQSSISSVSCEPEGRPNATTGAPSPRSTTFNVSEFRDNGTIYPSSESIMEVMLRDAMLRLREGGYSILALAMRVKYADLMGLQNITVFAPDDSAIFAGGHSYVNNVRFHVVPGKYLTHSDLMGLPTGSYLPTLAHGESLVVTTPGIGLRINYVPIRVPDVLFNFKIVVHGVFFPFPNLDQTTMEMAPVLPPKRRMVWDAADVADL